MYQAKYATLIDEVFYEKGEDVSFPEGTDSYYINRLLKEGVIIKAQEIKELKEEAKKGTKGKKASQDSQEQKND